MRINLFIIWIVVSLIYSIFLCFIPLFNILGYEFSLAITPFLVAASFHLSIIYVKNHLKLILSILVIHLIVLVPITLNAFRITNCNIIDGFIYFFLLAIPSSLLASSIGTFLNTILNKTFKTIIVFIFILILSLSYSILNFYNEPTVFIYNHIFGYIHGPLYDEQLTITKALLSFRLQTVILSFLLLNFSSAIQFFKDKNLISWKNIFATLFFILSFASLQYFSSSLGFNIDRDYIKRSLGGEYKTEHFTIIYSKKSISKKELLLTAQDHEFRYYQLSKMLKYKLNKKVTSYIYPNAITKKQLMGAKYTMVAKPWLYEIHLNQRDFPHSVLKHELAHVFSADYGSGPLKLSTKFGLLINMGIVEGFAVATAWNYKDLTPHEYSKAMINMEIAPSLDKLLGAYGFYVSESFKAYTICGSFFRFLLDNHGPEKLARVYTNGEFEKTYNEPIENLINKWVTFVGKIKLTDKQKTIAQNKLIRRKSIFKKKCAHEISKLRKQSNSAFNNAEYELAKNYSNKILEYIPNDEYAETKIIQCNIQSKQYSDAINSIHNLLKETSTYDKFKTTILENLGDIHWLKDEYQKAIDIYSKALLIASSPYKQRRLIIKKEGLKLKQKSGKILLDIFIKNQYDLLFHNLYSIINNEPDFIYANYMLGRALIQRNSEKDGIIHLKTILQNDFVPKVIKKEALRLIILANYKLNNVSEFFFYLNKEKEEELLTSTYLVNEEWIERINWYNEFYSSN